MSSTSQQKKTLHELRTSGFHKLRPGKIHIRCDVCGRKYSNAETSEFDVEGAFLAEFACDKCGQGNKGGPLRYFDAQGMELFDDLSRNSKNWTEFREAIERLSGPGSYMGEFKRKN